MMLPELLSLRSPSRRMKVLQQLFPHRGTAFAVPLLFRRKHLLHPSLFSFSFSFLFPLHAPPISKSIPEDLSAVSWGNFLVSLCGGLLSSPPHVSANGAYPFVSGVASKTSGLKRSYVIQRLNYMVKICQLIVVLLPSNSEHRELRQTVDSRTPSQRHRCCLTNSSSCGSTKDLSCSKGPPSKNPSE